MLNCVNWIMDHQVIIVKREVNDVNFTTSFCPKKGHNYKMASNNFKTFKDIFQRDKNPSSYGFWNIIIS
jgi:hypothetical protein